ncbi:LLM class flavin-dependent oxidoreductase [Metabacillus indicus]|uniref:LLM class flavin-dependent oxidoreductase n=1 Tax=Metabacillus indicus TaxID=246786 RepID=UPI0024902316|nr:LLM class flavin-dependent oxidoreductase [Metabacillus indicus]
MSITGNQIEFGWFISTTGDGAYIGVKPERESTAEYMISVAKKAEEAGFTFALIPTGGSCLDAWITGSMIASHTSILKPLVAMRPGLIEPVLAARMAATLDVLSKGRALVNIVTGGSPDDLRATGDPLADHHDKRYDRTLEFLQIVKGLWDQQAPAEGNEFLAAHAAGSGKGLFYKGDYYAIERGASQPAPVQKPHPPIYFGGSSAAGKKTAAKTADVYLMWAEPLEWIKEQMEEMRDLLKKEKEETGVERSLKFGLRAQVLVRETEEEAYRAAWNIISKVDQRAVEQSSVRFSRSDAVNQKRQNKLRAQSADQDYFAGPNLWTGLSSVRGGGSLLLVGTPDQVSDRILEYADLGISSFILSGYPNLEESEITGKLLLPLIKEKRKTSALGGGHV